MTEPNKTMFRTLSFPDNTLKFLFCPLLKLAKIKPTWYSNNISKLFLPSVRSALKRPLHSYLVFHPNASY